MDFAARPVSGGSEVRGGGLMRKGRRVDVVFSEVCVASARVMRFDVYAPRRPLLT